jgi:putative PEP-CTERM system histidine kinase
MLSHVTATSHLIGALAYALAVALIVASHTRHRYTGLLLAACVATFAWAGAVTAAAFLDAPPLSLNVAITLLDQLRSGAWIAVLAFMLFIAYGKRVDTKVAMTTAAILVAAMIYSVAVPVVAAYVADVPALLLRGVYLAHVIVAIAALLLVENLFRNSGREVRWSVKYLCFALGVAFAYDFFVYAQAALVGGIEASVYAARGLVQAMVMPLIILSAARSQSWPINVHVSRGFVFHSVTLMAAGAYLLVMSVTGYSLRVIGSEWGTVAQVSFMMAALLVLAVVLSSGEAQARLRSFIDQNFFTYKYDYRAEWQRFIDGISDESQDLTIPERVIQVLANIIGSTSGKIWVRREEDRVFRAVGSWNMSDSGHEIPVTDPWLKALADHADVVHLKHAPDEPRADGALRAPEWLSLYEQGLILLPLIHAQQLVGFVVLGEMRAPRPFNWEDMQLLKTAARQAASYIAEENAARALAQIKRFEEFNHRFAFIVHDVKNLAAQMTLILKNAQRHGDNPEFQKDLLNTVGESVGRLRAMIEQLKNPRLAAPAATTIDLVELLNEVVCDWKLQMPNLECDLPPGPLHITGQPEQLRAVICHLIQNALDAVGQEGEIGLELHIEGVMRSGADVVPDDNKCWAVITIADNGPGMENKFVETQLFQPLRSTKSSGFGIGAFQARQVAREMGGRLEVDSKCGSGTRVTVRLPYVPPTVGVDRWNAAKTNAPLLRSA